MTYSKSILSKGCKPKPHDIPNSSLIFACLIKCLPIMVYLGVNTES